MPEAEKAGTRWPCGLPWFSRSTHSLLDGLSLASRSYLLALSLPRERSEDCSQESQDPEQNKTIARKPWFMVWARALAFGL